MSWSGGGSASPRRTSPSARLAPGSTRNAGSARQSSGSSVREGSIGVGPESSTCRCSSSAANTQTSRGGHGSFGGSFGSAIAFGRPSMRESTRERVAAAAHLHAQRGVLDARRQVARHGDRRRSRQERSLERDLPRAAGDLELEPRLDEERDAVADPAEDLEPEAVALAVGLGARAEPQQPGRVAPRPRHRLAVEPEVDEADLRRERSATRAGATRRSGRSGGAGPPRRAGAARRPCRRRAPARRRRGRPAASVRAAGKAHVRRTVGVELELERAAGRAELELQLARPEADGLPWTVAQPSVGTCSSTHGTQGRSDGGRVVPRNGLGAGVWRSGDERGGESQPSNGQRHEASHGHLLGPDVRRPDPITAEGYGLFPLRQKAGRRFLGTPGRSDFGESPDTAGGRPYLTDPRAHGIRMTIR